MQINGVYIVNYANLCFNAVFQIIDILNYLPSAIACARKLPLIILYNIQPLKVSTVYFAHFQERCARLECPCENSVISRPGKLPTRPTSLQAGIFYR